MKKKFTKGKVLAFIIVLALLVTSIVPLVRIISDRPALLGEQTFYDMRISKAIMENGFAFEDELVLGGRQYIARPYHLLFAPIVYVFDAELVFLISHILISFISAMLLYLILRELKLDIKAIFFILLIFLLSPVFISTVATTSEFNVSIFLILLGTYLFLRNSRSHIPALAVFLVASVFNLFNVVFIIFLLMFLSDLDANKRRSANLIIAFVLILSFLYYIPLYFQTNFFSKLALIGKNTPASFISDLGGMLGFSIFAVILGLIGIIGSWEHRKNMRHIYSLLFLMFFAGFYLNYANIYINLILSIFAGLSLTRIFSMKWEVDVLKRLTMLVIIYGLLFSSISYVNRIYVEEPDGDIKYALEWLNLKAGGTDVVFSHESRGLWIEYWANNPVVLDSRLDADNVEERVNDTQTLFYSRSINTTQKLLAKYDVTYIVIDNQMKDGLVWTQKTGLWYSFRNNETFKNVYERRGIEVWQHIFIEND